mgnify:FL=1
MSEWKEKTLGELSIRVSSGLTPLKSNKEFWKNPIIPWLKTDQLGEKYIFDTNTKISKEALEQTSLRIYPENTISIAMYGEGKTRGNLSIIKAPMTTNQACCNIELDTKLADVEYVYYYLKTQYDALRKLSSGVRKNLSSNDIKNYKIYMPESVSVQKSIIRILTSLDNKINLNNQINQELEAMAKTLYDYWFVQFDFPDQNGKPYKSSGGKMVYNPELKREIPEGWEVEKLGDMAQFKNGINYEKTSSGSEKVKIINVRNISSSTIFINQTDLDEIFLENDKSTNFIVNEGMILITRSGIPGATRLVSELEAKTVYSGFIIASEVNDLIYKNLIFYYLKHVEEVLKNQSAGTIMKNISQSVLTDMAVSLPPQNVLLKFNSIIDNLLEQMKNVQRQNQELTQLRDWLLPMLMNGQVII